MERKLFLTKRGHMSAAHRLANPAFDDARNLTIYGHCFRHHGHNYTLEVTVRGVPAPETGMVMDLADLEARINAAVIDLMDHRDLDIDVPALRGVITTGENLVRACWRLLDAGLPPGALHRVAIVETERNRFEYYGEGPLPEGAL